jgi:hypothetical protein
MDNQTPEAPKRRGRRPKSATPEVDSSKLKTIQLDDDLKELINKKNTRPDLKPLRVKIPSSVADEIGINITSLNQMGNTKMDENTYVRHALELANENLNEILRRHLTQ